MEQESKRDALESLPSPAELRRALAQRVREADVLRRLLKVSEYAANELDDDLQRPGREGVSNG